MKLRFMPNRTCSSMIPYSIIKPIILLILDKIFLAQSLNYLLMNIFELILCHIAYIKHSQYSLFSYD